MVNKEEATIIVKRYLDLDDDPTVFIEEGLTVEFEYGWFFFINRQIILR